MRRAIPSAAPIRSHENGMSCQTPAVYTYDANGHRRWCVDCGAELGEVSWVLGGADVKDWAIGAGIALLGVLLLVVALAMALATPPANQGGTGGGRATPHPTPAPYGPPDANRHRIPDPGTRPTPNVPVGSLPGAPR